MYILVHINSILKKCSQLICIYFSNLTNKFVKKYNINIPCQKHKTNMKFTFQNYEYPRLIGKVVPICYANITLNKKKCQICHRNFRAQAIYMNM